MIRECVHLEQRDTLRGGSERHDLFCRLLGEWCPSCDGCKAQGYGEEEQEAEPEGADTAPYAGGKEHHAFGGVETVRVLPSGGEDSGPEEGRSPGGVGEELAGPCDGQALRPLQSSREQWVAAQARRNREAGEMFDDWWMFGERHAVARLRKMFK